MKIYTLLRAKDSVQLTTDELLAEMDRQQELGNHIEKLKNTKFWGENTYMICYW